MPRPPVMATSRKIRYRLAELTRGCREMPREEIVRRLAGLKIKVNHARAGRPPAEDPDTAPQPPYPFPGPSATRLIAMESRLVSKCFQCGEPIFRGVDILYDPAQRRARHALCPHILR